MYSSHDMLAQVAATLKVKAPQVLGAAARRKGLLLEQFMKTLPQHRQRDIVNLRLIDARYTTGDYRHDDRDIGTLERVGNWLLELHQTAGGHPEKQVQIHQAAMQSKKPLSDGRAERGIPRPPGSLYREMHARVLEQLSA